MAVYSPWDSPAADLETGYTDDPWLSDILKGRLNSSGPATSNAGPWGRPTQSAPEGMTVNNSQPGSLGGFGPFVTGVGALAGAPTTDQGVYDQANTFNDWFNSTRVGQLLNRAASNKSPRWGPAPAPATAPEARPSNVPPTGQSIKLGDGTNPIPITTYPGHGPGRSPSGPAPPLPPTGDGLPPFNRGPIPNDLPQGNVPYPPPRPSDLVGIKSRDGSGGGGRGRAGPGPAPPMVNLQPQPGWTTIDRPNADIVGGPTRPGYLSADPHEPGGPARMGAFDFSTLFNHPQVAAAAAQHPAVQAAARRAPVRGPLGRGALGQGQGQQQQAPGRIDPEIVARSQLPPGRIDPEIVARQMRGQPSGPLWPQGFL